MFALASAILIFVTRYCEIFLRRVHFIIKKEIAFTDI